MLRVKNLVVAGAALAALASTSVLAAPQTGTVSFTGTVGAACTAISPTTATINLGAISTGVGSLDAAVINAVSGSYGSTITCNGAGTQLSLWTKPIVGSVAVPAGAPAAFTNQVDYVARLRRTAGGYAQNPFNAANGVLVRDNSNGGASTQAVGLLLTDVELDLLNAALPSGATTMVAGNYTGEVVITLTPGV